MPKFTVPGAEKSSKTPIFGSITKVFKVTSDPVEICYDVFGPDSASKKILLLSGLNSLGCVYKGLTAYFSQIPDYQICFFDNRGVGESSAPSGRYSTQQMASDALALLNHLGWTDSAGPNKGLTHIAGVSMGGMIAQELALLAPSNIASVTLMSTHAGTVLNSPAAILNLPKIALTKDPEARLSFALRLNFPELFLKEKAAPETGFDTQFDYVKAFLLNVVSKKPLQQRAGIFGQISAATFHRVRAERLAKLHELYCADSTKRILVVTGTKDKIISPHHSLYLADKLDSKLEIFVGSGHALFIEQPDRINSLLRYFIEYVSSKGTAKLPQTEAERLEKYVPKNLRYYNLIKVEKPKKDADLATLEDEASREAL